MNIEKLKLAEAAFLAQYPEGFADPGLAPIRKKHNVADRIRPGKPDQGTLQPTRAHRRDTGENHQSIVYGLYVRKAQVSRFRRLPEQP